ncbi:MAG: lysozyme inhibitor LprI family protein [Hyphomonas sp.]
MRLCLSVLVVCILPMGLASAQCELPADICEVQAAFEQADDELGLLLESLYIRIGDDDFDDFQVDPAALASSLEESQTAWRAYREAQCAAVFRLMSGGTSAQVDELTCLAELTEARTAQLRLVYDGTVETVTDDDLSWLNGIWFESCDSKKAAYQFYVTGDGVYAEVAPDEDRPSDTSQMAEAEILLANNGYVEVTPFGWENTFLRVKPDGEDRMVGDLLEMFSDTTVPLEPIDLVQCWAIPDSVE